jgi:hypothetical protein
VFLLSPANLGGRRGQILLGETAEFALARALRSVAGAELGEVFGFVSSLYFRGKLSYARAFGRTLNDLPAVHVMSAGGGLCSPNERVTVDRLRNWASVAIHEDNPNFTAPLLRHASALSDAHEPITRFVLLGSVASKKYVEPLLEVFDDRLLFPIEFRGLGDMSRGGLLFRAVRAERELAYAPVREHVRF